MGVFLWSFKSVSMGEMSRMLVLQPLNILCAENMRKNRKKQECYTCNNCGKHEWL